MVMPLSDEDKPKCYVCHRTFPDLESLRKHHESQHPGNQTPASREPAPGDVTVF